jgi:uncharacterized FAD-dependent dehydrogenase
MIKSQYDVVFIGAGVANIAGAYYLHSKGSKINFLLIDSGKNVTKRNHDSEDDCIGGIGGAGLFSDGKFAPFPAGTDVWKLNENILKRSYDFLKTVIFKKYFDFPDLPSDLSSSFHQSDKWQLKEYAVKYLNLAERKQLGIDMTIDYYDNNNRFMLNTQVVDILKHSDGQLENGHLTEGYVIKCQNIITGHTTDILTKKIVVGGGRFMPILLKKVKFIPMQFKRVELGARFEGKSTNPLFSVSDMIDPKFMKYDKERQIEYRTFCWCREGEVVLTNYNGIRTWSGRSDCEETGLSNFGFNVRFKNPEKINLLEHALQIKPFKINFTDIDQLKAHYGDFADHYLEGLKSFIIHSGKTLEDFKDFQLAGPTIEGVGEYPITDPDLKVPNEDIWITGDCTGKFRGIIAAMVSGIFVCDQLFEQSIKQLV